ncbi:hypothetical protein HMPREF9622_00883 [Cutibacterium modestum HL037PA3]|nr:hypothetical protein HMPREF9622_00883 [Cutibacterium modestum HL037PA3]
MCWFSQPTPRDTNHRDDAHGHLAFVTPLQYYDLFSDSSLVSGR